MMKLCLYICGYVNSMCKVKKRNNTTHLKSDGTGQVLCHLGFSSKMSLIKISSAELSLSQWFLNLLLIKALVPELSAKA